MRIPHDEERYLAFLERVSAGEGKLHAGNVSPYELVEQCLSYGFWNANMRNISDEEKTALNATWSAMPDYGGELSPYAFMMEVLGSERYDPIAA